MKQKILRKTEFVKAIKNKWSNLKDEIEKNV